MIPQPNPRDRYAKEQAWFAESVASFLREFKQPGGREQREFEHRLYYLIQRAQTLAQEPLLDRLTQMASAMPMLPTFLKTPTPEEPKT